MIFPDPAFLFCFLPITLLLFAVAGRFLGPPGACSVLILATLVFCVPYGWPFVCVVVVSALANHAAFLFLTRQTAPEAARLRSCVFVGMLFFNIATLIAVKYGVLFSGIPGAEPYFAMIANAIPVTISFFTFQRIVMICDAYQRRPEILEVAGSDFRSQLRLGAFSMMFPNLVIGPIAYASEIVGQLGRSTFGRIQASDVRVALTIMAIGFAKKTLIADQLDTFVVSPVFNAISAGQRVAPIEAVAGVCGFYGLLYFDFSGYSDIAIGIARLFGLELPMNFNSPLRATGIVDFYKRWHITLTRVIARLLYTPLALIGTRFALKHRLRGARSRIFTNWLPFLVNFEVIGLWHGAKWTYVVFGLYHGAWFILETEIRSTKKWKAYVKRTSGNFRLRMGQVTTFVPLALSFALFRSHSLQDFGRLMSNFNGNWLAVVSDPASRILPYREPVFYLTVAFATIWLLPNAYEFLRKYQPGIVTWPVPSTTPRWTNFAWRPTLLWGAVASALAFMVVRSLNAPTPFVYGGF
jgi:alginate O-acetyltransferase complex protein AlgI